MDNNTSTETRNDVTSGSANSYAEIIDTNISLEASLARLASATRSLSASRRNW